MLCSSFQKPINTAGLDEEQSASLDGVFAQSLAIKLVEDPVISNDMRGRSAGPERG